MSSRGKIVGFDRKIELAWLDATAGQVARGANPKEVRAYLRKMLEGSVSTGGSGFNSDRGKTITVLAHVWSDVPPGMRALRDRSAKLVEGLDSTERLTLHWTMCLATYPFFHDVAAVVGNALALHGEVRRAELQRRLAERWGDREIVSRAAQRIIRTFVAWEVLADGVKPGRYVSDGPRRVVPVPLAESLIQAVLFNSEGSAVPIRQVCDSPALFPFDLRVGVREVRGFAGVVLEREGVGRELLRLASGERRAAAGTGEGP